MLKNRWLTAIVALLMLGVMLAYFYGWQPKVAERLVPIQQADMIVQVNSYAEQEANTERFYFVMSPLWLSERHALPTAQFAELLTQVQWRAVEPVEFNWVDDIWLTQEDGTYSYVKMGYMSDAYYLKDMASNTFYEIAKEQAAAFNELITAPHKESVFWKDFLAFAMILLIAGAMTSWSKARFYVEDVMVKKKKTGESLLPLGIFYVVLLLPDTYGAYHALLVATMLLIMCALGDIIEKRSYTVTHLAVVCVVLLLLYGWQFAL